MTTSTYSINWHRLFGILLTDVFTNTPYQVELEKELTAKQQFLDVVIIRKSDLPDPNPQHLPDGLENLSTHNLLTYKSFRESLTPWSLDELIGHYVNYRKLLTKKKQQGLKESDFQWYAVTTRYPHKLFKQYPPTIKNSVSGIYELLWGSHSVRIIVLKEIGNDTRNAAWHLFSDEAQRIHMGALHYVWKQNVTPILIYELYHFYRLEEHINMAYTLEQFEAEILARIPIEKRLKGLPPEQRLKGLLPEERLQGLSPEEIKNLLQRYSIQPPKNK